MHWLTKTRIAIAKVAFNRKEGFSYVGAWIELWEIFYTECADDTEVRGVHWETRKKEYGKLLRHVDVEKNAKDEVGMMKTKEWRATEKTAREHKF